MQEIDFDSFFHIYSEQVCPIKSGYINWGGRCSIDETTNSRQFGGESGVVW